MKLRNKISGEVKTFELFDGKELQGGVTLERLVEEWEDYEEPKDYWYFDTVNNGVCHNTNPWEVDIDDDKEIGNYFKTKEEAEKAVEKLKAWKRLKDKGFRFNGEEVFSEGLLEIDGVLPALKGADTKERLKMLDDLNICFGGEE